MSGSPWPSSTPSSNKTNGCGPEDAGGRDARNGQGRIDGCGYGAGSHPARVGVRPSGGQGFLRREAEARATSHRDLWFGD